MSDQKQQKQRSQTHKTSDSETEPYSFLRKLGKKTQNELKGGLLHRETLRANLADISFVGAIIILLFYTSKNLWLPSAFAFIFSHKTSFCF